MQTGRIAEKRAIVTGGANGIGRACCKVFAREGASVAVVDMDEAAAEETVKTLQRSENQSHCVIKTDIGSPDDVKNAIKTAEEAFGGKKCNVLVNCAGILKKWTPFGGLSLKDLDDTFRVNFRGVYLMSKEFVHSLKEDEAEVRGSIINISSFAGRNGQKYEAEYAASKAAVIGLTRSIALEYPEHRIRANAILPGVVDTRMNEKMSEIERKERKKIIPMGRFGRAEEIANACLFLASDECLFINGASLDINGGQ